MFNKIMLLLCSVFVICLITQANANEQKKPNVLFIISDDLTATALSCYGNKVCETPNIDALASAGTRFTKAYCQATYCGPSRASFLSGYYPHATNVFGYISPRKAIGDKQTWPEYFKKNGYNSTRVSKIYHMNVPRGIEEGTDGADDPRSWTEKFNSQGPEWRAEGQGETLERNPNGTKPVVGGNTFVYVKAEGGDLSHSDGKTAAKASELLRQYEKQDKPFFLAVGFVRPHVPFVSPKKYYKDLDFQDMILPPKIKDDWKDIPRAGINYKTSKNMKMNILKQKKSVGSYYASVKYMDAMVGKVLKTLKETGLDKNTIVIFTSDHGYHLGEHDFWAKVSLHEESVVVPLIIKAPGKSPAVCNSFVELLDLYPTIAKMCGLKKQTRLQGLDISKLLDNPKQKVRDTILCANGKGILLRDKDWAFISYGKNGNKGYELFDMKKDPKQYTNLAKSPKHKTILNRFKRRLANKLKAVRNHDL